MTLTFIIQMGTASPSVPPRVPPLVPPRVPPASYPVSHPDNTTAVSCMYAYNINVVCRALLIHSC